MVINLEFIKNVLKNYGIILSNNLKEYIGKVQLKKELKHFVTELDTNLYSIFKRRNRRYYIL